MAARTRRSKSAAHSSVRSGAPGTLRPQPQPRAARPAGPEAGGAGRIAIVVAAITVAVVAVIGAELVFGALSGSGKSAATASASASTAPSVVRSAPPASKPSIGVIVQGDGGTWVNVTTDELALMLKTKDFTFINVKTPYIGEIEGTDLWIPYDQLKARASELPADKGAKIVIYCRTGTTSAIGAQNLLDLGYWNVWNLDGGMEAWQASGRTIVNKNR